MIATFYMTINDYKSKSTGEDQGLIQAEKDLCGEKYNTCENILLGNFTEEGDFITHFHELVNAREILDSKEDGLILVELETNEDFLLNKCILLDRSRILYSKQDIDVEGLKKEYVIRKITKELVCYVIATIEDVIKQEHKVYRVRR